jgi:hypothetical protein
MKTTTTVLLLALLPLAASASTITLETGWAVHGVGGLGAGAVTLDVDGTDVTSYDYTLAYFATVGETWTADLTMLPTIPTYYDADPDAAFKDAEVTWAATILSEATTPTAIIAAQYALYGIFDPSAPFDSLSIADGIEAYNDAKGGAAPGWIFLDSPADAKNYVQGFVYATPEPSTLLLIGGGLLAIGWRKVRR